MSSVRGLGHVNLRANADLIERLRRFYIDIIGLDEGPRPAFRSGSRGHWLYADSSDVMHLTVAPDGDTSPRATGHFNHLAFHCTGLAATRSRLDTAGINYATDIVDELGQTQLFLVDPAGIQIELTFYAANNPPSHDPLAERR